MRYRPFPRKMYTYHIGVSRANFARARDGEQDQPTGETGAGHRARNVGWQQSPKHDAVVDQANPAGEPAVADKFVVGNFAVEVGRLSCANSTLQNADSIDAEQLQSKTDDSGNCLVFISAESIGIGDDAPERDLHELAPVHPAVVPIGANAKGARNWRAASIFGLLL